MTDNAKIYIRSKDVIDIFDSNQISPQHAYLVAEFGSRQYILRAGPSGKNFFGGDGGDPFFGQLRFVGAESLVPYTSANSEFMHYDWDYESNDFSLEIARGSDDEIATIFNNLRSIAREVNQENFNYLWTSQNCNTALNYVLQKADFEINLSNVKDQNGNSLYMIGSEYQLTEKYTGEYKNFYNSLFEFADKYNAGAIKIKLNNEFILMKESFYRLFSEAENIKSDSVFFDENNHKTDYQQVVYTIQDKDGKNFSFIRNDVKKIANDNSQTSIDLLIENYQEVINYTKEYLESSIESINTIFDNPEELSSIILSIAEGLNNDESLNQIARKISLKYQIKFLMGDIQNSLIFSPEDYKKIINYDFEDLSPEAYESISIIQNSNFYKIAYSSILSFVSEVAIREGDLNSQQYMQIASSAIAQSSANLAINHALNSYFGEASQGLMALESGIGYGASHLINVAINDIFADDKMNSHQWQSSINIAGLVASAAGVGSALSSALIAGSFAGPIGAAVAVAISYSMIGGKELNHNEFFEKIDFYQKIYSDQKSSPDFYALKSYDFRDGIIINSLPYYNSNIYGGDNDDSLIGGNGTNTLIGYNGNDQIFGKNNNDIIYGNSGSDTIIAGDGDDIIFGGEDDDILYGGGDNDLIYDQNLSQILSNIQTDNDLIHGGKGDDIIISSTGNDIIFGDDGIDIIKAHSGDNIIFGGGGSNDIKSGDGTDIIFAGNDGDYIDGENDKDEIYGGDGDDIIDGNEGDDIIFSGLGKNLIFGGAGNDIIYAQFNNKIISIGDYQNSLHGELGNDTIIASPNNDLITDGEGDDIIFSGSGDDEIIIGSGNNIIYYDVQSNLNVIKASDYIIQQNSSGENAIYLRNFSSNLSPVFKKIDNNLEINFIDNQSSFTNNQIIIENQFLNSQNLLIKKLILNNNFLNLADIDLSINNPQNHLFRTFDNQEIIIKDQNFSAIYDQILLSQDLNQISLFGNSNNSYDKIFQFSAGELSNVDSEIFNEVQWQQIKKQRNILGGHYTVWQKNYNFDITLNGDNSSAIGNVWQEQIFGNNYANQIYSGSGNDKLWGRFGDDILFGSTGEDYLNGGSDHDLLVGGQDNDIIDGSSGNDEIFGNQGNDIIQDYQGINVIFGGEGEDSIKISHSGNHIFGESGHDIIEVIDNQFSEENEFINENIFGNIIYGNSGDDSIKSGKKNDFLFGQDGNDLIIGGLGADYISGGEGNDILQGDSDNDKIFGDIGNDIIDGGDGDDSIWGGGGFDSIKTGKGNDMVRAGEGDDEILNIAGDDYIFGQAGNDIIKLFDGNNYIDGGLDNDQIFGGSGDDKLFGNFGNDLIIDGLGDDEISGGEGDDIFIIESSNDNILTIDKIKDFNPNQDKIIIKSNYKNQLNFLDILNNSQNKIDGCELIIGNQKLFLNNVKLPDLTPKNFAIGFTLNQNSKIFFADNYGQIIFGNSLNNDIFGSNFDDEIFGGGGSDNIYGLDGNDILHYEIDDRFTKNQQIIFSDEIGYYRTYQSLISRAIIERYSKEYYNYQPKSNFVNLSNNLNNTVFESAYELIFSNKSSPQVISISSSRIVNEPFRSSNYLSLQKVEKIDFTYYQNFYFKTINYHSQKETDITSYNRSLDNFYGGEGFNSLVLTNGNDFLSFDDNNLSIKNSSSRINSIEAIFALDGNDIINFSSPQYLADNYIVYGGFGGDKIWLGEGYDQVYGNEGDDEIYSGSGDDLINGGEGQNIIYAGEGNDLINSWEGKDIIFAENGDDKIYLSSNNISIDGGNGIDEINLGSFENGVNINLLNHQIENLFTNNKTTVLNIENIIATNFNDIIIGDSGNNQINPLNGEDELFGELGNDIYIIDANSGLKTITENGENHDVLIFNKITDKSIILNKINDDLLIYNNNQQNIIIKNQFIDDCKIDEIIFDNKNILLEKNFIISDEDRSIEINQEFLNKKLSLKNQLQISNIRCNYGSIFINEFNNLIYQPNNNFFGFDMIEIIDDNIVNKIQIYINPMNDIVVGEVPDFDFKVNQSNQIDLKQYFFDNENDKINFKVSIDGFKNLPNWLQLNPETSVITTEIAKSGEINLKLDIYENNIFRFTDNFQIKISRDLVVDAPQNIIKNIISGDQDSNKIYSQQKNHDIVVADKGDDEIFYLEDDIWINTPELNFKAWNIYSGDIFDVSFKVRSFDCFDGGEGEDSIYLTKKDDAFFLDDQGLSNFGNITKFSDIEKIFADDGNDIIDLTSLNFSYGDISLFGQDGNDILWSNDGDDFIYGGNGNDNIHAGNGNDILNGEDGDDKINGYYGNDIFIGGLGADKIITGDGFDIIKYESLADSNKNSFDVIEDFDFLNDQISLVKMGFDNILKYDNTEFNIEYQGLKTLNYSFENGNTKIFDNNSDFLILMQGNYELTNHNFIFH